VLGKLVLASAATATSRVHLGALVARVGLVPDATLHSELATLDAVSSGRLIAGLGTGDAKSDDEQIAYGIDLIPAPRRRRSLERLVVELRNAGIEVWVGGGSASTNEVARGCGAVLNLWDAPPQAVAVAARAGPTSWGGPLPKDPAVAAEQLRRLAEAGAMYAVWAWPGSVDLVVETVAASGVERG
jgi:alkanesulfonate monooxygenase SsuD/methylene tetrahydromethanopterin reductase-like flavin-dependent oxidoreductase (luciferase family)